jgi:hypothetical protein
MTERATHLTGSETRLSERLSRDQISHGLGLGEIELAGEEGPLRELAWLGKASAHAQPAAKQHLKNYRRTMRGDLNEIF